jgi:hypothetical protein
MDRVLCTAPASVPIECPCRRVTQRRIMQPMEGSNHGSIPLHYPRKV